MNRIIITILVMLISVTNMHAEINISDKLPPISGTYLEQILQTHNVAYSSFMDKDYLLASFIAENKKKFNTVDLMSIKEHLNNLSASDLMVLTDMEFKDPAISVVLSVLVGGLGVDRFYIGDIGLGVVKLITCGGFGLWWFIDMFTISGKTKKNNAKDLSETLLLQEIMTD